MVSTFLNAWRTAGPLTRAMLLIDVAVASIGIVVLGAAVAFWHLGAPVGIALAFVALSLVPFALSVAMFRQTLDHNTEF